MNEADPSPINLDELRMLPDWLREETPPPSKQYAGHDYPTDDRRDNRRGGGGGGFDSRGGGGNRDRRGAGGPPDRRREGGGRSGPPPRGGMNRDRGPRDDRRGPPPPPQAPAQPAPVRIEFVPDELCLASINKQIRTTHLAYPLFGLARMFLQEPARHVVQFTLLSDAPEGSGLYQLGDDGIVTLDRAILEKQAFDSSKEQFYTEESVQKEPLKGNFTNVARERLSGTLLGPTNYHAYQPALRSLYDTRYSRRMSFDEFRRNIEVSSDPALIEKWKEEARTSTTISTKVGEGETPVILNTLADAKAHFRQHHLDSLVRSGKTFKVHGSIARKLPEPAMMQAIREAHDREMRYPAQFVQLLRQGLQNSGLHIFKHRKRVVYVSLSRPTPFVAHGTVTPAVAAILETIAQFPLCTRKVLAERVLSRYSESAKEPEASVPTAPVESAPSAEPTLETNAAVEEQLEAISEPKTMAPATEPTAETATVPTAESPTEAVENAPAVESSTKSEDAAAITEAPTAPAAPTPAPAPAHAAPDTAAAKSKAALAADLRFLVQAGHIIEFHNGTFDLPLPPKAKEDETSKPAANKGNKPKQVAPTAAAADAAETVPMGAEPVSDANVSLPGTAFVAAGAGVEEAVAGTAEAAAESVPSLQEQLEPAPTAETVAMADPAPDSERENLTVEQVVIEPGPTPEPSLTGEALPDKVDTDGLISGREAAPLDPPVPGDTEDTPDSRS